MINKLKKELDLFWEWSKITPEIYSKLGWVNTEYEAEWEYPKLATLYNETIMLLVTGNKTNEDYNLILEVIAIDNEGGYILDECELYLTYNELELLIINGIKHIQPEARWQIAQLIGKIGTKEFDKYLLSMINDSHKYTQRLALISLKEINPSLSENILFDKLTESDDYIRWVSIKMLKELNSTRVREAINILKDDKFENIINEIKDLI